MTDDAGRIPAWRRLGLALKNEDQSGVTVPESHTQRSETQHVVPFDAQKDARQTFQPSEVLAVNGKSSSLGKRKLALEPAEESGLTLKKSRTPHTKHETAGAAAPEAPIIINADNAEAKDSNTQEAALADTTARPKGDPNYRKKKAKPNKRKRQDEHVAPSQLNVSPDESVPTIVRPTLLASTETDHRDLVTVRTPQRQLNANKSSTKDSSGSPERRKSVAFTPDTKTTDGHTGQDLFKKWASEIKSSGLDAVAPGGPGPKSHISNTKEEKKRAKSEQRKEPPPAEINPSKRHTTEQGGKHTPETPATIINSSTVVKTSLQKGKKKDPSVYIAYLTQYHTSRDYWKFNKAKQNDVVDNALNIFRIPEQHSDALLEYVSGLKGAGVIDRLHERCSSTLKELDEQDSQDTASMDDPNIRKAAQEAALQERITKEAKRRKVEGDVERLLNHPHGDGYVRRLQRKRAEALLAALGRTAPVLPAPSQTSSINPMVQKLAAPPMRDSQKRKRRGNISSDESSSDNSSDEESSSSESESEDDDDSNSSSSSDAGTSTSLRSAESSDSDSNSESNSDASSGGGSDTDSDSD